MYYSLEAAHGRELEGVIALSGVAGQSCSQNPWTVSILEEKIELHPIREAGLAISDRGQCPLHLSTRTLTNSALSVKIEMMTIIVTLDIERPFIVAQIQRGQIAWHSPEARSLQSLACDRGSARS